MRNNFEYQLCKSIAIYLRNQFPSVIYHFDLAGLNLSRAQAGMTKGIQGNRGWPDLFIAQGKWGDAFDPGDKKGLFVEIKKQGTKIFLRDGHTLVSDPHIREQAAMLSELRKQGYEAQFGVGFDNIKKIIDDYLKN